MEKDLHRKFNAILKKEEALARSVVYSAIVPRKISVWEYLIPIIFVMNHTKDIQQREILVQNMIFTKKTALDASINIALKKEDLKEALAAIKLRTEKLLSNEQTKAIYSAGIRDCQIEEIEFLISHYQRLLYSSGQDFNELLKSAYTKEEYIKFLKKLKTLEDKVRKAALETLGDKVNADFLERLLKSKENAMTKETEKIFF